MPLCPPDPPLSDGEVTLRPFDGRDREAVASGLADPAVVHRFGKSELTPEEFIERKEAGWRDGTGGAFAICDSGGRVVGQVFIELGDAATAEIGYWLLPEGRGFGFATRAVRLVSRWAFAELGIARLGIWAAVDNVESARVAERSGFVHEGTLRSFREREGERYDVGLYSLIPGDLDR